MLLSWSCIKKTYEAELYVSERDCLLWLKLKAGKWLLFVWHLRWVSFPSLAIPKRKAGDWNDQETLRKDREKQLWIVLVLEKEDKELNVGHLPECSEGWACQEIQRRGRGSFELWVYLTEKSAVSSQTWSFLQPSIYHFMIYICKRKYASVLTKCKCLWRN